MRKVLKDKLAFMPSETNISGEGQLKSLTNPHPAIRRDVISNELVLFLVHLIITLYKATQNLNSNRSFPTLPSYIT